MTRRGRVRRVAKWAGLVLCALILGLWGLSLRATAGRVSRVSPFRLIYAGVGRGVVAFSTWERQEPASGDGTYSTPRWIWKARDPGVPIEWLPRYRTLGLNTYRCVTIPFWLLGVLAAGPSVWLWWRDRRRRGPGRCAVCGYDLTGLAPGALCPECGSMQGAAVGDR